MVKTLVYIHDGVMNAHVRPSLFMERIKSRVFLNPLRIVPSPLRKKS